MNIFVYPGKYYLFFFLNTEWCKTLLYAVTILNNRLGDEAQTKWWFQWAQWPLFDVRTVYNDTEGAFTRLIRTCCPGT